MNQALELARSLSENERVSLFIDAENHSIYAPVTILKYKGDQLIRLKQREQNFWKTQRVVYSEDYTYDLKDRLIGREVLSETENKSVYYEYDDEKDRLTGFQTIDHKPNKSTKTKLEYGLEGTTDAGLLIGLVEYDILGNELRTKHFEYENGRVCESRETTQSGGGRIKKASFSYNLATGILETIETVDGIISGDIEKVTILRDNQRRIISKQIEILGEKSIKIIFEYFEERVNGRKVLKVTNRLIAA